MSIEGTSGITAGDVIVEFEDRARRGYDPDAVDAHLRTIAQGVTELQARLSERGEDEESLGLVLRATRRSVDEALSEARETAARTIADADERSASTLSDAETRANALVSEAESRATTMVADSELRSRSLDADTEERSRTADLKARERYAELGRLLEVREVELEALDIEIERRQETLRTAGADLIKLADGFIDLRVDDDDDEFTDRLGDALSDDAGEAEVAKVDSTLPAPGAIADHPST